MTGDDLLLQHAVEFARHAGGEKEARLADVECEAAGGADRVVDHLGGGGQHCLFHVVRRHGAHAAGEEGLHRRQPFFVQDEFDAGGLGGDFLRQVVDGGTEAAIDDHGIGAGGGKLEGGQAGSRGRHRRWCPSGRTNPTSSSFCAM